MDTKDWIVSTSALIGAGLGIFNLVRAYLTDAERGSVAVVEGGVDGFPGVEVVNRSPFPITITELGSVYEDGQIGRVVLHQGRQDKLPQRIEARDAWFFHVDMRETITRATRKTRYTYARTALGAVFTSERHPARCWRRFLERLRLKAANV